MSLTLAMDTTGRGGQLAIARSGELLAVVRHDEAQGHAESLSALIDELLAASGVALEQLERVAVVRGPGSFTGLRIGIMSAKALAFARGLPLFSAATLPLMASSTAGEPAFALLAAGGDHLFGAAYADEVETAAPRRLSVAEARAHCERASISRCVHGEDARSARLAAELGLRRSEPVALGERLARLASEGRWPCESADPIALVPEYLALSQAERSHGVDLSRQVHTPGAVEEWE